MPKINIQRPPSSTNGKAPAKSKLGGVLNRISDISFDPEDGIQIMLYGRSGTGKTTLWGTFPKPILAMICSGGLRTGELRSLDTPENQGKIQSVVLNSPEEFKTIVDYQAREVPYKTLVLDHVSGFQDLVLCDLLGLAEIPAQKGWGLASQQQWGQVAAQCKEYIRSMLNLACNVVIIGQERENKPKEGLIESNNWAVGVATIPSLAEWLNPAVDYICQTFIRAKMINGSMKVAGKDMPTRKRAGGVEYCLRTGPHDVFTTKFRKPKDRVLPEVLVNPTYESIYAIIKGK